MQLHHQTSVGQVSPRNLEPGWRQFDPPLKMAMRDLQPMYPRFRQFRRQWALAADQQHSGAQRDLNPIHFDTGQGNQDRQGVVGLEDVAWRFPVRRRVPAVKKLAVKTLCTFHCLAGS